MILMLVVLPDFDPLLKSTYICLQIDWTDNEFEFDNELELGLT